MHSRPIRAGQSSASCLGCAGEDRIFLIGGLQGLVQLCDGAVDGLVDQSQVLFVLQAQELEQIVPMVRVELVQTAGLP